MFSNLLDNPKLFRHVLEDLPVGIYIVDRERRIRFWNRRAEQLTGHLGQEVVGHVLEDIVQACDRWGHRLMGEHCPVTIALRQGLPQHCTVYCLHKNGHRVALRIRTRAVLEHGDVIEGAAVLLEETFVDSEELSGPPMYGCLDATTGIPSCRLTRAVLNECMAGVEESHLGFGVLRIRVLGLEEFRAKHGPQSVVPFLRTAAHTLRHSLDAENFLGCWGETRVSGGAAHGESGDGSDDGGNGMEPAASFGSVVVGRPFSDCERGGLHHGHGGQRPGIPSRRDEAVALECDGEGGSRGRRQRF